MKLDVYVQVHTEGDHAGDCAVVEPDGTLRKPRKRRRKEKPIQHFAPPAASSDPPKTT